MGEPGPGGRTCREQTRGSQPREGEPRSRSLEGACRWVLLLTPPGPPRAEDEASVAAGQLVPGAHPVPSEPVPGAAALGQGAAAPGSLTHELRARPPQQASPHRPQGQCLGFSLSRDSSQLEILPSVP